MSKLPFFRNLENLSPRKIQLGDTEFSFCKPVDHGLSERDQIKRKIAIRILISQVLEARQQAQNGAPYHHPRLNYSFGSPRIEILNHQELSDQHQLGNLPAKPLLSSEGNLHQPIHFFSQNNFLVPAPFCLSFILHSSSELSEELQITSQSYLSAGLDAVWFNPTMLLKCIQLKFVY